MGDTVSPQLATTSTAFTAALTADKTKLSVRPARREDIPGIVEVWRTSVTDDVVAGFGAPLSDSPFKDVETLSSAWIDPNSVRSEEIHVAEIDRRVVGCVTVEDREDSLELVNIDVMGELQCHGFGTHMVRHVEHLAIERGKRAVTLGTSRRADGVPWKSLPWWLSRGYRITHEEENEWTRKIGPGVKEIRMRRDL